MKEYELRKALKEKMPTATAKVCNAAIMPSFEVSDHSSRKSRQYNTILRLDVRCGRTSPSPIKPLVEMVSGHRFHQPGVPLPPFPRLAYPIYQRESPWSAGRLSIT